MKTPKKYGKVLPESKKKATAKGAATEESRIFNMPENVKEVKVEADQYCRN